MYFTVSIYMGLGDYVMSPKMKTITSAVDYFKLKVKKIHCLGYHFEFFEDDGLKLRCHSIEFNIGDHPKNVSYFCKYRSITSFKKSLSSYIKVAKENELPF